MSTGSRRLACVFALLVCLLSIGASPMMVRGAERTMQSNPIVLFEIFTATWSPQCGGIGIIVDDIEANYGSANIATIEYHFNQKNGALDPFTAAGNMDRLDYYNPTGIPCVNIDGPIQFAGLDTISYPACAYNINSRLATPRDFDLSVSGNISDGNVNVHLEQLGSVSMTNLTLRYALTEGSVYCINGTDPDRTYHNVARVIPLDDKITLPLTEALDIQKTFSVNPDWVKENLTFVAYLQNDVGKEVLQATGYGYIYGLVPEISPLVVIPLSGMMVAVFALAFRIRRKEQ